MLSSSHVTSTRSCPSFSGANSFVTGGAPVGVWSRQRKRLTLSNNRSLRVHALTPERSKRTINCFIPFVAYLSKGGFCGASERRFRRRPGADTDCLQQSRRADNTILNGHIIVRRTCQHYDLLPQSDSPSQCWAAVQRKGHLLEWK